MDLFFDIPESQPTPLEKARTRYAAALSAYNAADENEDEWGDPVPSSIAKEYHTARRQLLSAEQDEARRIKR